MMRKDKEIIDKRTIDSIIEKSLVCRLSLTDGTYPYVIPLCFGYKDNMLYFHSACEGKKIDLIKKNNNVCFEFDIEQKIIEKDKACNWGMEYFSVIGFGKAHLIENFDLKQEAFNIIMNHYSDKSFTYSESAIHNTLIIKIDIENITAKKSG